MFFLYLFLSGFSYKVGCSPTEMRVEMVKPADVKKVYLEHLKNYPGEARLDAARVLIVTFMRSDSR